MAAGYRGRYAVHEASRVDILRLLVRHGAHLNVHDYDGQTPIHIASRHSNIQILHELVRAGADWRAVDHLGRSAIHHASLGNAVCVRMDPVTRVGSTGAGPQQKSSGPDKNNDCSC